MASFLRSPSFWLRRGRADVPFFSMKFAIPLLADGVIEPPSPYPFPKFDNFFLLNLRGKEAMILSCFFTEKALCQPPSVLIKNSDFNHCRPFPPLSLPFGKTCKAFSILYHRFDFAVVFPFLFFSVKMFELPPTFFFLPTLFVPLPQNSGPYKDVPNQLSPLFFHLISPAIQADFFSPLGEWRCLPPFFRF